MSTWALDTPAENGTKSFSCGHWDTLVWGDILLRKTLSKRIIWAASSVTLLNLYNFSKTNNSKLKLDRDVKRLV